MQMFKTLSPKDFYLSPMALMKQLPADYVGTMAAVNQRYGPLVHLKAFAGMMNIAFISDPEINREIYVRHHDKLVKSPSQIQTFLYAAGHSVATAHGQDWRTKRQEANQLFSRQTVEALAGAQVSAVSDFLSTQNLDRHVEGCEFAKMLAATTTGRSILGRAVNTDEAAELIAFSNEARDRFNAESRHLFARPNWMLAPWRQKLTAQIAKVSPLIARAIQVVKSETGQNDGLMHHYVQGDFLTSTDKEVLTLMTGLLAGALDNIAAGVAWWLAMMTYHPQAQAVVAAEVRANLGDAPATPELLAQCQALNASVLETLRMRPPAQGNQPRMLAEPLEIAGARLPKNTFIMNSIYNMHQNPAFFDAPDQFDLSRFTSGSADKSVGYVPFGHGPRNCVARGMATQQIAAIGAAILRDYDLTPKLGTSLPQIEQTPFLVPAAFQMQLQRR